MLPFFAEADTHGLMSMLIPVIAVSFSMAIPIVAIITERFQKRDRMRLIEKAIEHGANIEDLNLEENDCQPRLPYRNGMVCVAVGIGLIVGHSFVRDRLAAYEVGELSLIILLGGLIVGCVGLALLGNDYMNRDKLNEPSRP